MAFACDARHMLGGQGHIKRGSTQRTQGVGLESPQAVAQHLGCWLKTQVLRPLPWRIWLCGFWAGAQEPGCQITALVSHVLSGEMYILPSLEGMMCFPLWEAMK